MQDSYPEKVQPNHVARSVFKPAWTFVLILLCATLLVACDSGLTELADDTPDIDLDAELTDVITLGGQRRLENFVLPASDDFASIPQDNRNPLTAEKVELGRYLFHETALSRGAYHQDYLGTYSCATCHHADAGFQAGRQQSIGDGGVGWGKIGEGRRPAAAYSPGDVDAPPVRSPSVLNTAYQKIMLWSGAAGADGPNRGTEGFWQDFGGAAFNHLGYDGLESQAITALSTHRMGDIDTAVLTTNDTYQALWMDAFPGEPVDQERAGLAIAAFERTVLANRAPFQMWLKGNENAMTAAEKRGAIVFFGEANCSDCHNGAPLSSPAFYALGMPDMQGPTVVSPASDSRGRGEFIPGPENDYKFKVPQLYNLVDSPFYGHGGTFKSIREVVHYYNHGIPARALPEGTVTSQFHPLELSEQQIDDLVAFLTNALRDPDLHRYVPQSLPSGNCFPANDPQARVDLGCD